MSNELLCEEKIDIRKEEEKVSALYIVVATSKKVYTQFCDFLRDNGFKENESVIKSVEHGSTFYQPWVDRAQAFIPEVPDNFAIVLTFPRDSQNCATKTNEEGSRSSEILVYEHVMDILSQSDGDSNKLSLLPIRACILVGPAHLIVPNGTAARSEKVYVGGEVYRCVEQKYHSSNYGDSKEHEQCCFSFLRSNNCFIGELEGKLSIYLDELRIASGDFDMRGMSHPIETSNNNIFDDWLKDEFNVDAYVPVYYGFLKACIQSVESKKCRYHNHTHHCSPIQVASFFYAKNRTNDKKLDLFNMDKAYTMVKEYIACLVEMSDVDKRGLRRR